MQGCFRGWIPRRLIYTKKLIAFSNLKEEDVLDVIPMSEIFIIRDMSILDKIAEDGSDSEDEVLDCSVENEERTKNVLQIETTPDGYNSGRPYQIQAKNGQDFRTLFDDLTKFSAIAREEAEKKSKFNKLQAKVGKVFNSKPMQQFFAMMIIGVRLLLAQFIILKSTNVIVTLAPCG